MCTLSDMKELILRYADIDTRRALGVYGRLPRSDFVPRPIPPISFRYWPEKKTVVYTEFGEFYEFTVYRDISRLDEGWSPCEISSTWRDRRGEYVYSFTFADMPFHFAGTPEILTQTTESSQNRQANQTYGPTS